MRASCSPNRYATLLPSHIEPAPPGEYERTVPAEPHRHRRQAVGDGEVGEETAVDGAAVVAVIPEATADDEGRQHGGVDAGARHRDRGLDCEARRREVDREELVDVHAGVARGPAVSVLTVVIT